LETGGGYLGFDGDGIAQASDSLEVAHGPLGRLALEMPVHGTRQGDEVIVHDTLHRPGRDIDGSLQRGVDLGRDVGVAQRTPVVSYSYFSGHAGNTMDPQGGLFGQELLRIAVNLTTESDDPVLCGHVNMRTVDAGHPLEFLDHSGFERCISWMCLDGHRSIVYRDTCTK